MKKLGEGATPGPWQVFCAPAGAVYVHGIGTNNGTVCRVGENRETQANARLIAKAPLLVEARDVLTELARMYDEIDGFADLVGDDGAFSLVFELLQKLDAE